jgi:hypothetical protein
MNERKFAGRATPQLPLAIAMSEEMSLGQQEGKAAAAALLL